MRVCCQVRYCSNFQECILISLSLSNRHSDEDLERDVQGIFDAYGQCWAKIRRDKNKMPFAFVQFEVSSGRVSRGLANPSQQEECAREAIRAASSSILHGRPIRVEGAKVHRTFYPLSKSSPSLSLLLHPVHLPSRLTDSSWLTCPCRNHLHFSHHRWPHRRG